MKTSYNYGGAENKYADYNNSKAVIIPIPYDRTTTYVHGTSMGPEAIIKASKYIELYDEELDKITAKIGISTLKPLKLSCGPEAMINKARSYCQNIINDNKFPVVLGGEHSVSIGPLLALKQKYHNISVLQFDAHADLRDKYKGSKYNHACVMARIREHCSAVQIGIRSISYEESVIIKERKYPVFWAKDMVETGIKIDEILKQLTDNVYITIDLDVFDPGAVPAVGTPEPGGLSWYNALSIAKAVFSKKNVVGFDIMELCPNKASIASDFIAAKLIYKLLGYKFNQRN